MLSKQKVKIGEMVCFIAITKDNPQKSHGKFFTPSNPILDDLQKIQSSS
jgi:hypothetical protein